MSSKKKLKPGPKPHPAKMSDIDILDECKVIFLLAIRNKERPPNFGGIVGLLRMKQSLTTQSDGERQFWKLVNGIRAEELQKNNGND